jgi:methylenetetrahydrofolate reductase (NADH)
MRIDEIIRSTYPCFSFEFFPPKTEEGMATLLETIPALKPLEPAFCSVTYGAAGSTRDRTVEIVRKIKDEFGLEAMAHLSTVGSTVDELKEVLAEVEAAGIDNVLALRGDPPKGEGKWKPTPGGVNSAAELAGLISGEFDFAIGGACFPEVHPEAPDLETDLAYLKTKVENGATFLITQLFFDNQLYWGFVPEARAVGIDVPIIPGIMPIRSFKQIRRFCEFCGASIPERLEAQMTALGGDEQAEFELGVAYAAQQCAELLAGGAPGLHFYTLNRAPATRAILGALRAARPWERGAGAQSAEDTAAAAVSAARPA